VTAPLGPGPGWDGGPCERRGCRHDQASHLGAAGACGWCPCAAYAAPEPEACELPAGCPDCGADDGGVAEDGHGHLAYLCRACGGGFDLTALAVQAAADLIGAQRGVTVDAAEVLDQLGALFSPDLAAYAAGEADVPRCALCLGLPCECPPFGTPEYFALIDRRHGRGPRA
jgi:hypothetical protein